jgi:acylphosphatase
MAKQARRITVHGMVQGVGFRFFVQRVGRRLGLTGDVRNLPDWTVEIVVEGNPGPLEEFIREVRRGPPMAHVERLEIHDIAVSGSYSSFSIEGW